MQRSTLLIAFCLSSQLFGATFQDFKKAYRLHPQDYEKVISIFTKLNTNDKNSARRLVPLICTQIAITNHAGE